MTMQNGEEPGEGARRYDSDVRLHALRRLQEGVHATVPTRLQLVSPELALGGATRRARQLAGLPALLVGTPRSRVRVVHNRERQPYTWFYLWPSSDAEPDPEHLYPLGEATRLVDQILAWWTELTTPLTDSDHPHQDRSAPRRADTQPIEQMAPWTDSCEHPNIFLNPAHVDIGAS